MYTCYKYNYVHVRCMYEYTFNRYMYMQGACNTHLIRNHMCCTKIIIQVILFAQVSISCSYWLINRTGLPLVFKQEGASYEAAGQLDEHERASTTTPLLFSYSEGELVEKYVIMKSFTTLVSFGNFRL